MWFPEPRSSDVPCRTRRRPCLPYSLLHRPDQAHDDEDWRNVSGRIVACAEVGTRIVKAGGRSSRAAGDADVIPADHQLTILASHMRGTFPGPVYQTIKLPDTRRVSGKRASEACLSVLLHGMRREAGSLLSLVMTVTGCGVSLLGQ